MNMNLKLNYISQKSYMICNLQIMVHNKYNKYHHKENIHHYYNIYQHHMIDIHHYWDHYRYSKYFHIINIRVQNLNISHFNMKGNQYLMVHYKKYRMNHKDYIMLYYYPHNNLPRRSIMMYLCMKVHFDKSCNQYDLVQNMRHKYNDIYYMYSEKINIHHSSSQNIGYSDSQHKLNKIYRN